MGLPSYVVNFDELSDLLKDYLSKGVNVEIGNVSFSTTELENLVKDIGSKIQGVDYNQLITALNNLGVKLEGLSGNLGLTGTQKIYGKMLGITHHLNEEGVEEGLHIIEFIVPANGRLTGITYSLSSWRDEDSWDLVVNNKKLFTTVRTKEYGEHKFFNVFYPITAGQKIQFIYNNESGSNRTLWVDFNILED